jgi:hypothetical protein
MGFLVQSTQGNHLVDLSDVPNSLKDKKFKKLLKRVSALDHDLRHLDVRAKRAKNTGKWLLNSRKFQEWEAYRDTSGCRALCAFGPPGAGKTTALYVHYNPVQVRNF